MSLTDRKKLILKAVVMDFIRTAEPVGSMAVVRGYMPSVSSATVRNELADLESRGFLCQPHTSAGRVPTVMGYRLYVDELMEKRRLEASEMIEIQNAMQKSVLKFEHMIRDVADVLSDLTGGLTVVTTPRLSRNKIKAVKLVRLDSFNLVLIVFAEGDVVKHSHIKLDFPADEQSVNRISVAINREFSNLRMEELDEQSFLRVMYTFPSAIELVSRVLKLIIKAVEESAEIGITVSGTSNMFDFPGAENPAKAKELYEFVCDSRNFKQIAPSIAKEGVSVLIGCETGVSQLENHSITASRYLRDENGIIAVITPLRTDYEKCVSVMEYVNRHMRRVVGHPNEKQLMIRKNGIFLDTI